MAEQFEALETINRLIKDIKVAMLVTRNLDGDLHSRPMMNQSVEFDGEIWFFAKRDSDKVMDIIANPLVNVSYSDDGKFVSIAGIADIVSDVAKKKELWHEDLRVWFDAGAESPEVVLIHIVGKSAQYWDTPDNILAKAISVVKVMFTRDKDAAGDSEKVQF
jgi:general stress protein 26